MRTDAQMTDVAGLLHEFAGACRDRMPNARHLASQVRAAVADSSEVEVSVDPDGTHRKIARVPYRDESFQTDDPDVAASVAVEDLCRGFLFDKIDHDEAARRAERLAARFGRAEESAAGEKLPPLKPLERAIVETLREADELMTREALVAVKSIHEIKSDPKTIGKAVKVLMDLGLIDEPRGKGVGLAAVSRR